MSDARQIEVGDVIAAKYVVERVLGVGGMGIVVAARHAELGELYAIKLMLPELSENQAHVERFLREARAVVRFKSRHVAKVHDVGRLESGVPYMVMEYLEGRDLSAVLQERGPIPASEAAIWLIQAIEAVAEAHAGGIVHRDLKPSNLFLTHGIDGEPVVKVLDFGISKIVGAAAMDMTKTATSLGSPFYMSPEQMRSSRSVDARTDIWALGVILYELCTGVVPFDGEALPEVCLRVSVDPHVPPSQHRPELVTLDAIVDRCLAKDPAQRPASVASLAADLLPLAGEAARGVVDTISRLLRAPPPSRTSEPERIPTAAAPATPPAARTVASWVGSAADAPSGRRRRLWAALATAAGALVTLLVVVGLTRRSGNVETGPAAPPADTISTVAEPPEPAVASAVASTTAAPIVEPAGEPEGASSPPVAEPATSAPGKRKTGNQRPTSAPSAQPAPPPKTTKSSAPTWKVPVRER